jgi:hypothetical protein
MHKLTRYHLVRSPGYTSKMGNIEFRVRFLTVVSFPSFAAPTQGSQGRTHSGGGGGNEQRGAVRRNKEGESVSLRSCENNPN